MSASLFIWQINQYASGGKLVINEYMNIGFVNIIIWLIASGSVTCNMVVSKMDLHKQFSLHKKW